MSSLLLPKGRFKTRPIQVGPLQVGGDNPIRIQSMTTSDTRDVEATVEQVVRLADAGCEIVRVTVQGMKEAEACEQIKSRLIQKGVLVPLVADIHFYPPAALRVVEFVDKVRINPGNFSDRRATFKVEEVDAFVYKQELERIEEKFTPLVLKCKALGKALRIGTNHGSLSDRIMNRYGDTPDGMCESAFEYARICRKHDFHNFCFSMKSSNTRVMVQAYRLLVKRMVEMGWDYPLHLGVTEAGSGEDGRIKSAVGIGTLLLDGIGDTIRVSLTEDPWFEIDPCLRLRTLAERAVLEERTIFIEPKFEPTPLDGKVFISAPLDPGLNEADQADYVLSESAPKSSFEAVFAEDRFSALKADKPVVLSFSYEGDEEDVRIQAAAECGSLLLDGHAAALHLQGPFSSAYLRSLSFGILQAARMRSVKTEFISCPSCGRTLFNLQEVTRKVQEKTAHLAGVKIAVMGCIVNGPGEMADAHFGYVGSKAGMIDLYVGKTCVEKNIPSDEAVDRLVSLIKAHGMWKDAAPKALQPFP